MSRQDEQARVARLDHGHEHVFGRRIRSGAEASHLVAIGQRGLIAMVAIGNIERKRAKRLDETVQVIWHSDRPDALTFGCRGDRSGCQPQFHRRLLLYYLVQYLADCPWIVIHREQWTELGTRGA